MFFKKLLGKASRKRKTLDSVITTKRNIVVFHSLGNRKTTALQYWFTKMRIVFKCWPLDIGVVCCFLKSKKWHIKSRVILKA